MCEVCWFLFVGLFFLIIYLLDILNCKRKNNTQTPPTPYKIQYTHQEYIEVMTEEGQEVVREAMGIEPPQEQRESSFNSGESDPLRAPLSILIKVTKVNGESLPYGEVSTTLVEEIFQNSVGLVPLEVLVLND